MNLRWTASALAVAALLTVVPPAGPQSAASVRVIDAQTRQPLAGAIVTADRSELRTDAHGLVSLTRLPAGAVRARAYGYGRADGKAGARPGGTVEIALAPLRPRALYLTVYGIGSRPLRTGVYDLLDTTELNALVVDLKGDRGIIPYPSAIPLAARAGALRVKTIADLSALAADLHRRGVYAIARIVVFKDSLLATARPDLAVRRRNGAIYRDREDLAWTDPRSREVWDYNIAVAIEAARAGFDEIQFDYVRLPDATDLAWPSPWTQAARQAPIEGFLRAARTALIPYNVFLAADVFGYVCWNTNDTRIGQQLEHVTDIVDYVSPMLYPSSFQFGIPGYRNPVQHPREVVQLTLERGLARTQAPPLRFRPWLQAFRDYAFGGRAFGRAEIRAQIDAAEKVGTDGWMLWNPQNRYAGADITTAPPQAPRHPRIDLRP